MIRRYVGLGSAFAISMAVGSGILALIALDLLGEELFIKAWKSFQAEVSAPAAAEDPVLPDAKGITLFTSIPAKEHGLLVVTGVAYANVADFKAVRQRDRWCYVTINSHKAIPRQITLATQTGLAAPAYSDLSIYPPEELAAVGLTARTLQTLAKSHCRFAKANTRAPDMAFGGRA